MGDCGTSKFGTTFNPCVPGDIPGIDPGNGLFFDWIKLDLLTGAGLSFTQTGSFGVGDTGSIAGGVATYNFDLPARLVTIIDGLTNPSELIVQHVQLDIGNTTDTITIAAFDGTIGGLYTLHLDVYSQSAQGDPPVEINGTVTPIAAVPLPPTLALLALGFAGFAARRRVA